MSLVRNGDVFESPGHGTLVYSDGVWLEDVAADGGFPSGADGWLLAGLGDDPERDRLAGQIVLRRKVSADDITAKELSGALDRPTYRELLCEMNAMADLKAAVGRIIVASEVMIGTDEDVVDLDPPAGFKVLDDDSLVINWAEGWLDPMWVVEPVILTPALASRVAGVDGRRFTVYARSFHPDGELDCSGNWHFAEAMDGKDSRSG
jgi:hypothetical protein